jgi:ATP-binding protein involved in chromosome partitioning
MAPKKHPTIRSIIAVGSGKGGVGKSTVSLNLALALAEGGARVGLLDADIYGPNIPLMVGLVKDEWRKSWAIAGPTAASQVPVIERFGLKVVSAGLVIGDDQPLADSRLAQTIASQLLWQAKWSDLEYLIIDLPPGTGGVQQVLFGSVHLSGAVLVVTPQAAAHQDARKAFQVYQRAGVRVLGGVENMSGFNCPSCGDAVELFARVPVERSLWADGVERLGDIPIHGTISEAGDLGIPLMVSSPDSAQAQAFRRVCKALKRRLD